jgi:signal transduction histidine kinase
VSAYLHDPERDLLTPAAAYRVPREMLAELATLVLPLRDQGFHLPLWTERQPVSSDDVGADPRFAYYVFRRFPHQSGLVLPLLENDGVVGAFYLVWWTARRRLSDEELRVAWQIASQVSLFLRNARLFQKAEEDRRRLARLNEISRRLAEIHEPGEILQLIVDEARALLDVEATGLRLLEGDELVVRARSGDGTGGLMSRPRLRVGESLSGAVVAAGEPLVVEDITEDTRFDAGHKRAALELGFHGWLGVPLRTRGRIIGALSVYSRSRRRFGEDAVLLLSTFADQASLALEKSRLLDDMRAREREVAALYDVASELATSLRLDEILDLITRRTVEVVGGDAAGIYGWDAGRGGLVFRRGLHLDPALTANLVLRPGEGVAGRAFSERRPAWTRDRLDDSSLDYTRQAAAIVAGHAPRSYLAVPILGREDVVGVLVQYYNDPHEFSAQEIRLLSTLAHHAAVAIETARLFEETERQARRLAGIFDSTADGMMLVGPEGFVVSANRRAAELLEFDPAVAEGLGLAGILLRHYASEQEHRAALAALWAVIAGDAFGEGDLELPLAGRTLHWVARPAGAVAAGAAVTLTFQDVTQEREVSRMKSDFVSFVTHQLRTPLAGIRWMLELTAQGLPPDEEVTAFVADAREAAERLVGLVNDLLDISRLESGKILIAPAELSLADTTRGVLAELDGLVRDKQLAVDVASAPDVPNVKADPQLLRQVVLNLVSNAVKYTPAQGRVRIRFELDGGHVAWSVDDSGIGIPKDAQRHLFEKFYRADNARTVETEGTGLGLYLVRLIVERHGGRVWCESEEGRGSMFAFTLPL